MIIDPKKFPAGNDPRVPVQRLVKMLPVVLMLAGISATIPAAAEFTIEPRVDSSVRFDTNPRYRSGGADVDSVWGTVFDVRLPMEYATQRSTVSLVPRLVYNFYPDSDDDDLEERDEYLTGTANWAGRRSSIGTGYGYSDLSLRTSEFQDTDSLSPDGSGSADFFRDTQRRLYFQPYWQYQLSNTNLVSLNTGYEEVRYDELFTTNRRDYDFANVSGAFQHTLNERHAITLQARSTNFESENNRRTISSDSKTNSLTLIYSYVWSDRTKLSVDLGWAKTKNETSQTDGLNLVFGRFCTQVLPCEGESNSTNFVGNLTATHQSETTEYRIVVGQSITPNSTGAEVLRINVDALVKKKLSDRINAQISVVAFAQDSVDNVDNAISRDYLSARLRLNYQLTRRWTVYSSYRLTLNKEDFGSPGDRTIRNHIVFTGVVFRSNGWRW